MTDFEYGRGVQDILSSSLEVHVAFIPKGWSGFPIMEQLWPLTDYQRGSAEKKYRDDLNRYEVSVVLRNRFLVHRLFGVAEHKLPYFNLDLLFENTLSEDPPGDLEGEFLIRIYAPGARVYPRYMLPHGILPIGNEWTYRLPLSHLPGGNIRPASFVVVSEGAEHYKDAEKALERHRWIRREGEYLIPIHALSVERERQLEEEVGRDLDHWKLRTDGFRDSFADFGHERAIGGSGDHWRLGWSPMKEVSQLGWHDAADWLRGMLMWVEGNRPHWFEGIPMVPSNDPGSAYFFGGLHWTSRWKAGFRFVDNHYLPSMGNHHGWTGYNLEHFISMLPQLAFYTQDPLLLHMTKRLGKVAFNTLCSHDISEGGYFGGGFSSARGALRPMRTLLECSIVDPSLRSRYFLWVDKLLVTQPFMAHGPTRPDEQIPGHEGAPIVDNWQLGMGAHLWCGSVGDGRHNLLDHIQALHLQGWRGADVPTMEMAKQTLASDPTIGRAWHSRHDGLVKWNYALVKIPGLSGVDQAKRQRVQAAIEHQYPHINDGKWGCGEWEGFVPFSARVIE